MKYYYICKTNHERIMLYNHIKNNISNDISIQTFRFVGEDIESAEDFVEFPVLEIDFVIEGDNTFVNDINLIETSELDYLGGDLVDADFIYHLLGLKRLKPIYNGTGIKFKFI